MRRIDKFIGFLAVLAFAACESTAPEHDGGQPESPTPDGTPISLQSGLMPMALAGGDLQSVLDLKTGFVQDDKIGFFAGMIGADDILNLPLTLVGTTFNSDKLSHINAISQFLAYYPYQEGSDIYSEQGVSIYGKDGKVIDFLTTDYAGNGLSMTNATFYHTFAVVCIKCGNGFTHFDGDIYVQLKRMVKGVKIDWNSWTGGSAFCPVDLVYDDTATAKEQRRFKTTRIDTADDETYWAAIIPCKPVHAYVPNDATVGGVTVDAIVLSEKGTEDTEIPVNNEQVFKATITENGNVQSETTGLRGGSIYNLELQKVGFEASVFPCKVSPWKEGDEIKQTLEAGINNEADFRDFVAECNRLFREDKDYTDNITTILDGSEKMKSFGTNVNGTFTVFLKKDIDFANTDFDKAEGMTAVISCLPIPIDGRGHTISNIRLDGGFCGSLRSTLKSLTFKNIRVVQPAGSSDPVGMLADKMESGGTIEDCKVISGWLEGNGGTKVGAAVGTMNAGMITGSSFAGIMIGETDTEHDGLVGVYTIGEITGSTNNMTKSTMQMGN